MTSGRGARHRPHRMLQPRLDDGVVAVLDGGEHCTGKLAFVFRRRKAAGPRRHQHQTVDAVGMQQRKVQRHPAAK